MIPYAYCAPAKASGHHGHASFIHLSCLLTLSLQQELRAPGVGVGHGGDNVGHFCYCPPRSPAPTIHKAIIYPNLTARIDDSAMWLRKDLARNTDEHVH